MPFKLFGLVIYKMIENSSIWIVSDVDGTLMDHSYDLTPAKETIKTLQKISIPVILCTSKTAAEVKVIRNELNLTDPYIVENGAAIYGESLKKVNGEIILGKKYEFLEEILNSKNKMQKLGTEDPLVSELLGGKDEVKDNGLSRQDCIDQLVSLFNLWWPLFFPKTKQPENLSSLESILSILSAMVDKNAVVYSEGVAMA